jgi:hypothetical protein
MSPASASAITTSSAPQFEQNLDFAGFLVPQDWQNMGYLQRSLLDNDAQAFESSIDIAIMGHI